MKIASLVAGAVLATALSTSAFAFDAAKNAISITFAAKGKTVCAMTLSQPSKGVLVGKSSTGCGGTVAGFLTGSGSSELIALSSGGNSLAVEWIIEASKKTFIAIAFNGKTPATLSGTVVIK